MDFVDLQVFKCVVDEGGIIKAARKLHRVPSSVTTRVKQLETSLGVTLFHRDRQRLHLSPTGELLLAYAERLIQLSDETRAVVSGGMPQGALKLGALESTTASRLPRILADFHRRYPEVRPSARPESPCQRGDLVASAFWTGWGGSSAARSHRAGRVFSR